MPVKQSSNSLLRKVEDVGLKCDLEDKEETYIADEEVLMQVSEKSVGHTP